ncbi:MAG: ATP synthase F0 subunit B [Bdellovibrionales bacterium]|nr:ATP synthase F0 subunit B [Bdellovibrionales bacterium]
MELFKTLGLDGSILIQFGIFFVIYIIISQVLFKPYLRAFDKRREQTVGKTDTAERFVAETKELENEYETKAREISRKFKVLYDESRTQALKEHDRLVAEARAKAKELTEKAQQQISEEMAAAQAEIKKQVPEIAKSISQQLLSGSTI